jgi:hypothetical protein
MLRYVLGSNIMLFDGQRALQVRKTIRILSGMILAVLCLWISLDTKKQTPLITHKDKRSPNAIQKRTMHYSKASLFQC